jgi:hypothetical protein
MDLESASKQSKTPFYKLWWFWAVVVGTVVVLGVGGFLIYWFVFRDDYIHPDQKAYNDCKKAAYEQLIEAARKDEDGKTARKNLVTAMNKCIAERKEMAWEDFDKLKDSTEDEVKKSALFLNRSIFETLSDQYWAKFTSKDDDKFWDAFIGDEEKCDKAMGITGAAKLDRDEAKKIFARRIIGHRHDDLRGSKTANALAVAYEKLHDLDPDFLKGEVKAVQKACELTGSAIDAIGEDYYADRNLSSKDTAKAKAALKRMRSIKDIEAYVRAHGYWNTLWSLVKKSKQDLEAGLKIMNIPAYDRDKLLKAFETFAKRTSETRDADDDAFFGEFQDYGRHFYKDLIDKAYAA